MRTFVTALTALLLLAGCAQRRAEVETTSTTRSVTLGGATPAEQLARERRAWEQEQARLQSALDRGDRGTFLGEADLALLQAERDLEAWGQRAGDRAVETRDDLAARLEVARRELDEIGDAVEDGWQDMSRTFVSGWNQFRRDFADAFGI